MPSFDKSPTKKKTMKMMRATRSDVCSNLSHQDSFGGDRFGRSSTQEGASLENALRRFKRKVQTEDIIKEVRRHSYYLKPGEKRRLKQALARKRARKKNRREPD